VLLEAMAAGTPVLASAIPGYASVLTHGREGFLVEPKSPAALASGIVRLLSDAALRGRMAEAGRRTASLYDWPIVTAKLVEYYERVRATNIPRPARRWASRKRVAGQV
jgi:phosphatidylinositol alpha-mannosyltransferase